MSTKVYDLLGKNCNELSSEEKDFVGIYDGVWYIMKEKISAGVPYHDIDTYIKYISKFNIEHLGKFRSLELKHDLAKRTNTLSQYIYQDDAMEIIRNPYKRYDIGIITRSIDLTIDTLMLMHIEYIQRERMIDIAKKLHVKKCNFYIAKGCTRIRVPIMQGILSVALDYDFIYCNRKYLENCKFYCEGLIRSSKKPKTQKINEPLYFETFDDLFKEIEYLRHNVRIFRNWK